MTRREVMIQILSEVTGKSINQTTALLDPIIRRMEFMKPGSSKGFYVDLPEDETQELLEKLRKEKSGILNWLVQGSKEAHSLLERFGKQN